MTNSQIDEIACQPRRPGRPPIRSDEATLQLILDAAMDAFVADGFAGTGMSAVAQRAGVSTKTLYRLVPTKAELFHKVVAGRTARFVLEIDHLDNAAVEDVQAGLERLLTAYGNLTFAPDVMGVYRLVVSETCRFPELGRTFHDLAIRKTTEVMANWLARQRDLGRLRLAEPYLAAGMLRGMMVMEPQRAALLGQAPPPDAAQIAERAKACAAVFLKGCGV
ncbi:MAG TPA: TetR/AcrR family transcriptional regulator [Rhodopila sp.]|nr:TetR/AcrR family transcriptional regulator [Rhodopila sp.]